MTKELAVPLIVTTLLVCGCRPAGDAAGVSDSAGIRIVESKGPAGKTATWSFSSTPTLSIGSADGAPQNLLHRVYSAVKLATREILVSNSGTHELRVYARDGALVRSFGAMGQGPGEFEEFASMRVYPVSRDTLAITNGNNVALNVFSSDGKFVRGVSFAPVAGYGRHAAVGAFQGGDLLTSAPRGDGALRGAVGDRIESSYGLFRHSAAASSALLLASATGRPRIVNDLGNGSTHFPFVPLTPDNVHAVDGDDLLISDSGEPQFKRVDRSGRIVSIVRWRRALTPVAEIWTRFSKEFVAVVEEERRPAYARLLEHKNLGVPTHVPAIEALLVDQTGNVWAQRYRLPWETERRWDVIAKDGAWLGDVVTPAGVTVFEIGSDYLLGRHLDDMRVERVVLYALVRSY